MRQPNRSNTNGATDDDSPEGLLVRIGGVVRLLGLGRSTIYRLVAADEFPQPVKLTKRLVAWRRADLERWSRARPTARH